MSFFRSSSCALFALLFTCYSCSAAQTFTYNQSMPPRLQWLQNGGYCGEVSTVAAGLRWGQYLSQYDVRDIATGSQFKYYLLGENDIPTAIALRLNYSTYPNTCVPDNKRTCSHAFLSWMKYMARRGFSVTFTVYMNQWLFTGNPDYNAGNSDYDHIVSLYSWSSLHDDDGYYDDDVLTFSDHGLWNDDPQQPPPYLFTYNLSEFQGSRRQANAHRGNIYTLPDVCKSGNFGVAHRGPADPDGVLLSASIACSANFESPHIASRSEDRPPGMPLQLTVSITGTQLGVDYKAYIYGNSSKVPVKRFNELAADADDVLPFTGDGSGSLTFSRNSDSSRMFFVRVVRADAP